MGWELQGSQTSSAVTRLAPCRHGKVANRRSNSPPDSFLKYSEGERLAPSKYIKAKYLSFFSPKASCAGEMAQLDKSQLEAQGSELGSLESTLQNSVAEAMASSVLRNKS